MISFLVNDVKDVPNDEKERLKKEKTIKLTKTEFEHCVKNTDGKEEFYKLEKNRKYQLAHKSEIREYMKVYYQKNKSKWKQ